MTFSLLLFTSLVGVMWYSKLRILASEITDLSSNLCFLVILVKLNNFNLSFHIYRIGIILAPTFWVALRHNEIMNAMRLYMGW